jgi:hypothetical protein
MSRGKRGRGVAQIGRGVDQIRVRRSSDSGATNCCTAGPGSILVLPPVKRSLYMQQLWTNWPAMSCLFKYCLSRLYSSNLKKEANTGTVETLRKNEGKREKKEKEKRTTERIVMMSVRNGEEV